MNDAGTRAIAFFNDRYAIDPPVLSSLLAVALSRGGDFAELFFEHRTNSAIAFEDQRVKSASKNIAQGMGVRVVKGAAIGYAYTEALDLAAMRKAAQTAGQIGSADERSPLVNATPASYSTSYYDVRAPLSEEPSAVKVALLERADRAARAYDPSVTRVDASIGDELKYVMIARSDGSVIGDVQPLIRMNVSVVSERDG